MRRLLNDVEEGKFTLKNGKNGILRPPKSGPKGLKTSLFHVFHFNMGLNYPTEVIIEIPISFENTPL